MEIRRIREGEFPLIAEIGAEDIYQGDFSPEGMVKWLRGCGSRPFTQYFVAVESEVIAGFIGWSLHDRYEEKAMLELSFLGVKEGFRRRGIGTKLINESFKEVRKSWQRKGLQVSCVFVATDEDNTVSQRFYEKILDSLGTIQKVLIPDVWGKGTGTIFYFSKLLQE